jgi:hypothetical protein
MKTRHIGEGTQRLQQATQVADLEPRAQRPRSTGTTVVRATWAHRQAITECGCRNGSHANVTHLTARRMSGVPPDLLVRNCA